MIFLLFWIITWLILSNHYLITVFCVLIFHLYLFLLLALMIFIVVLSKEVLCNLKIIADLLQFQLTWWYLIVNMISFSLQLHFLSLIYLLLVFKSFNFSIDVISVHDGITNIFILHFQLLYLIFTFLYILFCFDYMFFNFILWYCCDTR